MAPPLNVAFDSASDTSSDLSENETKETEDQVPLEQFATDDQFAATLELLQLPPAERSRENVRIRKGRGQRKHNNIQLSTWFGPHAAAHIFNDRWEGEAPAEDIRIAQVKCIFELVRDNKFFAELDAEMSLELCRHMTYTTMKADRVLFYKGDPGKFPSPKKEHFLSFERLNQLELKQAPSNAHEHIYSDIQGRLLHMLSRQLVPDSGWKCWGVYRRAEGPSRGGG